MAKLAKLQSKPKRAPPARQKPAPKPAPAAPPSTAFGQPLQAKMTVGPAKDRFEAEADRVADSVLRGASAPPAISSLSAQPAQRQESHEEEETLQTKKKKPEEELQRKAKPEEELQRKSSPEEELQRQAEEEETELQREAASAGPISASPSVESAVAAARGRGRPLSAETRGKMEQGFGRDFGAVRVHDDSRAHRLSEDLSAHAFTTGSDIFFARGAYRPSTSSGQRLLAHELTHVVQQSGTGGVQTKRIQRNGGQQPSGSGNQPQTPPRTWPDPLGNANRGIDLTTQPHTYRLPQLMLPRIDGKLKGAEARGSITGGTSGLLPASGQWRWTGQGSRTELDAQGEPVGRPQRLIWERDVENPPLAAAITNRFGSSAPDIFRGGDPNQKVYYLRLGASQFKPTTLIGTAAELSQNSLLLRPTWPSFMEVDHYREIQHGGAHEIGNMWLLDRTTNNATGTRAKTDVQNALNDLFRDARQSNFFTGPNASADRSAFQGWPTDSAEILFGSIGSYSVSSASFYDRTEIEAGNHLPTLQALNSTELAAEGFQLGPNNQLTNVNVFIDRDRPFARRFTVNGNQLVYNGPAPFIDGFNLSRVEFPVPPQLSDGERIGCLWGRAFRTLSSVTVEQNGQVTTGENVEAEVDEGLIEIYSRTDLGYGGYLNTEILETQLYLAGAFNLLGMSPIAFNTGGINDDWQLFAGGNVTADNPLFPGFQFAIRVQGDAIFIDAPIPTERLNFGPFSVTEANLQVGFDTDGPFIGGNAAFQIEGLGQGTVEARRLNLAGTFNFDVEAFDPASVSVAYSDGNWAAEATLGVKQGVIPGVSSGEVSVTVNEEGFSLTGSAQLAGPGLPEGTSITIGYDEERGLTIGGELPLNTERIPGVRGARMAVTVTRTPEGEWSVAGNGTAEIELPGVTGSLTVMYADGQLTIIGAGEVSRPPLTGSLSMTASNAPADEEGNPIEGPPLETFRVFGSGSASIQFGRYITGTVGITLLENGEIELMGRIALPPEIPLIEERRYDYDIFDFPEVRFPIIGLTIPVLNRSVGVFGFVRGGMDAVVVVGPGVLRDTAVEAVYNPDRPEEASITGESQFDLSASAEVGLSITGGIGAGLAIVEATGEVGIRAGLGLVLTGGAQVQVGWTPVGGLEVDAGIFGEARPKFRVSLIAEARVVVDALLWSGELWSEDWEHELASFGPDVVWRAELPASWSEQSGLDLNINNLELTYPDISLSDFAAGVFDAAA